jgi:hypothetical protein
MCKGVKKNMDKINWMCLSMNPNAIPLLEKNMDKIEWPELCSNPNAIHLLQTIDYEKTKEYNADFKAELLERIFQPDRMIRLTKGIPLREYLNYYL